MKAIERTQLANYFNPTFMFMFLKSAKRYLNHFIDEAWIIDVCAHNVIQTCTHIYTFSHVKVFTKSHLFCNRTFAPITPLSLHIHLHFTLVLKCYLPFVLLEEDSSRRKYPSVKVSIVGRSHNFLTSSRLMQNSRKIINP